MHMSQVNILAQLILDVLSTVKEDNPAQLIRDVLSTGISSQLLVMIVSFL